ncbi:hypothetical protein L1987_01709 [Smallanthus sonchifolius]|uniref:Uncharacterized protein n=1 Tax=Smallanthus sonchifolius TaxID=185202 RepID=A0ACB9K5Y7_9ASTR|nr:hypothetical protein L1987_01709 [Smallanthus sonchifolius]
MLTLASPCHVSKCPLIFVVEYRVLLDMDIDQSASPWLEKSVDTYVLMDSAIMRATVCLHTVYLKRDPGVRALKWSKASEIGVLLLVGAGGIRLRRTQLSKRYVIVLCDGGVSDSSEGFVLLPSDGSGCCSDDSPSVATGNDDTMRMTCSSSEEGDMDVVIMLAMQCMYGNHVYHV